MIPYGIRKDAKQKEREANLTGDEDHLDYNFVTPAFFKKLNGLINHHLRIYCILLAGPQNTF